MIDEITEEGYVEFDPEGTEDHPDKRDGGESSPEVEGVPVKDLEKIDSDPPDRTYIQEPIIHNGELYVQDLMSDEDKKIPVNYTYTDRVPGEGDQVIVCLRNPDEAALVEVVQ